MISAASIRFAAARFNMHVQRSRGEWRITPNELSGSKAEAVAYYTDDNDDAYLTIVAMRRTQDAINTAATQRTTKG